MTGEDSREEKAKIKAFRLLALRARSEKELKSKLKEKGYDEVVVGSIVEKLREQRYLDDESFAGQWARNLGVNRLFSNRRIILSLREKGISPPLIEQAITNLRNEISETDAILKLIKKKLRSQDVTQIDYESRKKLARSLMGKGFPADLIYRMLNGLEEEFLNEGE